MKNILRFILTRLEIQLYLPFLNKDYILLKIDSLNQLNKININFSVTRYSLNISFILAEVTFWYKERTYPGLTVADNTKDKSSYSIDVLVEEQEKISKVLEKKFKTENVFSAGSGIVDDYIMLTTSTFIKAQNIKIPAKYKKQMLKEYQENLKKFNSLSKIKKLLYKEGWKS